MVNIVNKKIVSEITVPVKIELTSENIVQWLMNCDISEIDTLKYIHTKLKRHIYSLENSDSDDFRSRA